MFRGEDNLGREFTVLFNILHYGSLLDLSSLYFLHFVGKFYHVTLGANVNTFSESPLADMCAHTAHSSPSRICLRSLFGVTMFWKIFSLRFLITFMLRRNISEALGKETNSRSKNIVFLGGI